jgi:ABC-type Fe3+ transport system substrate-binding protein
MSDHPFAVLNAPWVTADQRAAALAFRDFLLSAPIQQLALKYGFRPANAAVSVSNGDQSNPFNQYRDNGVLVDIGAPVPTPEAGTLNALVQVWKDDVGR